MDIKYRAIGFCALAISSTAFAGSSPADLDCGKGGLSIKGVVPADEDDVNLVVKASGKKVALMDELSSEQLTPALAKAIHGVPRVLVNIGIETVLPSAGAYLLKVTAVKDAGSYLKISAASKKAARKKAGRQATYRFKANVDYLLQGLDASEVHVKDVDCAWTYNEP